MLLMLEVERRSGVRRRPKESEGERSGLGTVEVAVFALFGLMVAFTFSGAASHLTLRGSYLLCCSAWGSSVPWAGFRMPSGQQRSWLQILGFTVLTVIIVYVMLDVEYPQV
jgi:hypothetical protein